MEELSEITQSHRLKLDIEISSCHRDHRFEGKAVFPAVEAMQVLAASAQGFMSALSSLCIQDARFDKFLVLPAQAHLITAYHHIDIFRNGRVRSSLITRTRTPKLGISRTQSHVTIHFDTTKMDDLKFRLIPQHIPSDCFEIPAMRLYEELVPFSSSYHNVKGSTRISRGIAAAEVIAPVYATPPGPLGSPFPLDSAFHIACAWGQRFAGVVAFPVGLSLRRIFQPTRAGETYRAIVSPIGRDLKSLFFDIGIFGQNGDLMEMALGVQMRDVSSGRMKPPEWVIHKDSI